MFGKPWKQMVLWERAMFVVVGIWGLAACVLAIYAFVFYVLYGLGLLPLDVRP